MLSAFIVSGLAMLYYAGVGVLGNVVIAGFVATCSLIATCFMDLHYQTERLRAELEFVKVEVVNMSAQLPKRDEFQLAKKKKASGKK